MRGVSRQHLFIGVGAAGPDRSAAWGEVGFYTFEGFGVEGVEVGSVDCESLGFGEHCGETRKRKEAREGK